MVEVSFLPHEAKRPNSNAMTIRLRLLILFILCFVLIAIKFDGFETTKIENRNEKKPLFAMNNDFFCFTGKLRALKRLGYSFTTLSVNVCPSSIVTRIV